MINKIFSSFFILFLFALPLSQIQAERSNTYDDYVVHYNALSTNFLKPETAQQYNIKRSKNRGMLTISIQTKPVKNKAIGNPVNASIKGFGKNLNGQTHNLDFKQIDEGKAIYYISDFSITDQEVIDFSLSIKPEKQDKSYSLKFRQQFFTR